MTTYIIISAIGFPLAMLWAWIASSSYRQMNETLDVLEREQKTERADYYRNIKEIRDELEQMKEAHKSVSYKLQDAYRRAIYAGLGEWVEYGRWGGTTIKWNDEQ